MMSVTQQVAFFRSNAERAKTGLAIATSSGNFHLAALNLRQGFKCHLMLALLKWRHSLSSPASDLHACLTVARNASVELARIDAVVPLHSVFPVALPVVLSVLLGEREAELEDQGPNQEEFRAGDRSAPDIAWQWALATALQRPEDAGKFLAMIRTGQHPARVALSKRTYELYLSILDAPVRGGELIAEAEALYRKRSKDAYFSGGEPYYGGGPNNGDVVDFMLAAVLRRAGNKSSSEHEWRWT